MSEIKIQTYPYLEMPYAIIKGRRRKLTVRYINAVKELGLAILAFLREQTGDMCISGDLTLYDMAKSSRYLNCNFSEDSKHDYLSIRPGGAFVPVNWSDNRLLKRPARIQPGRRRKPIYVHCSEKKYPMPERLISSIKELLLAQIEMYRKLNIGRYKYGFAEIIDLGWSDFGDFILSNNRKLGSCFDPDSALIKVKYTDRSHA